MSTILSVAYPFAPVGPDAVGGSEQVLSALDRALVAAGHHSIVVAPEGSQIAGRHVPVPAEPGPIDDRVRKRATERQRAAVAGALQRCPVDLVHLHGLDFYSYLPPRGIRCLVTLHLPLSWYPAAELAPSRPQTWLHGVSSSQVRGVARHPALLPPIENGVAVRELGSVRHAKRDFALMLGRICPEKGVHLALAAAQRAGMALLIGGAVFPYLEHQRYFRDEIAPLLDSRRRFLGALGLVRRRRLTSAARCLVVPSQAPETSSLVAMEALACGTPVVAWASGALPEIVEHGRTGFIVDDVTQMAEAMREAGRLDRDLCRITALRRFSRQRMIARYFARYRALTNSARRMVTPEPVL